MSTAETNFELDAKARQFALETPLSFQTARDWMRTAYGLIGEDALRITDARVLQLVVRYSLAFVPD